MYLLMKEEKANLESVNESFLTQIEKMQSENAWLQTYIEQLESNSEHKDASLEKA